MKNTLLIIICIAFSSVAFSQKMITRSGEIKFDATVSGAMDSVIATSTTVSSIFDKSNGDLVVQGLVKSFKFKSSLMEEHFNENYMESDKFPKTSFKGKVIGFEGKSGSYDVEGELSIHGVSNKVNNSISFLYFKIKLKPKSYLNFFVNCKSFIKYNSYFV